jgi:hypothetical protein
MDDAREDIQESSSDDNANDIDGGEVMRTYIDQVLNSSAAFGSTLWPYNAATVLPPLTAQDIVQDAMDTPPRKSSATCPYPEAAYPLCGEEVPGRWAGAGESLSVQPPSRRTSLLTSSPSHAASESAVSVSSMYRNNTTAYNQEDNFCSEDLCAAVTRDILWDGEVLDRLLLCTCTYGNSTNTVMGNDGVSIHGHF